MPAARLLARPALACTAAACAVAVIAVTGCSTSSSSVAPTGRSVVLPAAKKFPAQVAATGVAWAGGISGGYEQCGANDPLASPAGDSSLQYTAQLLLTTFSQSTSYPVFRRQVVEALDGLGWSLEPTTGGSPAATYYNGRHGAVDLRLIELDQPGTFGPTATVFLSAACFDAGPLAEQLLKESPDYNASEPRPTATPTPDYS